MCLASVPLCASLAAGKGYQIVGFAWHKGVSDSSEPLSTEYNENLPDLIGDVRAELGEPNLPFVIATTAILAAGPPVESSPYTRDSLLQGELGLQHTNAVDMSPVHAVCSGNMDTQTADFYEIK